MNLFGLGQPQQPVFMAPVYSHGVPVGTYPIVSQPAPRAGFLSPITGFLSNIVNLLNGTPSDNRLPYGLNFGPNALPHRQPPRTKNAKKGKKKKAGG